jgi:hypothetical protein
LAGWDRLVTVDEARKIVNEWDWYPEKRIPENRSLLLDADKVLQRAWAKKKEKLARSRLRGPEWPV